MYLFGDWYYEFQVLVIAALVNPKFRQLDKVPKTYMFYIQNSNFYKIQNKKFTLLTKNVLKQGVGGDSGTVGYPWRDDHVDRI